ncbi:hypothetical protein CY34DRAFT_18717 [Suillus luteus UH-Slu-Lm8-n1]|uniref:Uncharacterized protein n=1 Tax=Suillus luteus UH-Slu-Lm8-n1 TaxID=930992 RepID=A0A0D0A3X6_9AGAM|nr:hypothetical protein CY34DRAFT_18717 [Suillus luteus UH-Slu-Lm8-n1]
MSPKEALTGKALSSFSAWLALTLGCKRSYHIAGPTMSSKEALTGKALSDIDCMVGSDTELQAPSKNMFM